MAKYAKLVQSLIKNVGGKNNIQDVQHCFTRLRFILKDETQALDEEIKNTQGVLQLVKAGGQYQIVIGSHVPEVYEELAEEIGLEKNSDKAPVSNTKQKPMDIFLSYVQGIITPNFTMMLCACAILNGINVLARYTGLYSTTSGIYVLFSGIGNAVLYLMPLYLGFNTAKRCGIEPFLGMTIGAAMCNVNVNGVAFTLFEQNIQATYTSTMLPVVLTVLCAAPLAKFLYKKIPAAARGFLAPCITLAVAVPLGFVILGPVATMIGNVIGGGLNSLIAVAPIFAGLIIGGLYNVFVVFGIHSAISVPSVTNVIAGIPDSFAAMRCGVCFAMAATALAVFIKTKNSEKKNIAFPAFISGMFGITEPALYGVAVPHIKLFVTSCIAGGIGGAVAGLLGCMAYGIGSGGIFQITGYMNPNDPVNSAIRILIVFILNFVVAFVLAWIVYKDEDGKTSAFDELESVKKYQSKVAVKAADIEIMSPIKGKVIPLGKVTDSAFAHETLGKGVAVIPSEGKVIAPFDGVVSALFNTNHAIGMTSDAGVEVLVHIGIDTVKLNGQHFTSHVKQGDKIKQGDLLVEFDIKAIQEAGYSMETPIIVTNTADYSDILVEKNASVNFREALLLVTNNQGA